MYTSSAVSLTAHGPYGACGLEGAPLRFARSYSLCSWGPILPCSLRSDGPYPTPTRYALWGATHTQTNRLTNIALYIEDNFLISDF